MVRPYAVLAAGVLATAGAGTSVDLDDAAHHHLVRVLRRRDGDEVVATDGTGREVDGVLHGRALAVTAVRDVGRRRPRIEVAQALGKGRKHDDVVRMLTEVGVDAVTALTTARTQVDLSGKADRARDRWQAVAEAACSQSRRPHRTDVGGPVDLDDWLAGVGDACVLVADVGATTGPLEVLAANAGHVATIAVVVGPEGGLTDGEVAGVEAAGGHRVSLGPTVLRTEHAGLALAAVVGAATGRMG